MDFSTPSRVADLLPAIRTFVTERIQPLEKRMAEGWSAIAPELERVRSEVKAARAGGRRTSTASTAAWGCP